MSTQARRQLVESLFPSGIPQLWCPPLTHFLANGQLDRARIAAHLRHISRHTQGWLIPGSTGEGWQMDDQEVRDVLDYTLSIAQQVGAHVLIGVLRQDASAAVDCIEETAEWLSQRAGTTDLLATFDHQNVCGFTVCPPTGAELSDADIGDALRRLLELGHPTALYQLPQITLNEMSPPLVAELATEYENFYLFKDTSGTDRVATSGVDLRNVFRVRGAEGQYTRWLKAAGGPYDGFLLSTANGFSAQLDEMIRCIGSNDLPGAERAIAAAEGVVHQVFQEVSSLTFGNPFTNANKAIDFFQAFGTDADTRAAPFLHDGQQLPTEVLVATREALRQADLLPTHGYLQS